MTTSEAARKFCQERLCSGRGEFQPLSHRCDLLGPREKRGEYTGLLDKHKQGIWEGDILLEPYNEHYGDVPVIVLWAPEKGAWISFGTFAGGGAHESLNGEHFKECEKVGHIDFEPEKYRPAGKKGEK